jgi:hypothetical protein
MLCGLSEMKCGFKILLPAVQTYYFYPIIGHTFGTVNPEAVAWYRLNSEMIHKIITQFKVP